MILLITGGRDFCESVKTTGEPRERDLYMDERRALGFALDFIKPTAIIVGGATGADRWAKIWADKRGVQLTRGRANYAIVFPGGYVPTGLELFSVTLK